ncbi:hypothetical protein L596_030365 [Steinernema carpocapsae]|nr:hypothetical protein L596_030365 [Steinernema carpocapsae]
MTSLIQISTRSNNYVIDPFLLWNDLWRLNEPFTNPKILKVLHACPTDSAYLRRDFGVHLVNVFDTQNASIVLRDLMSAKNSNLSLTQPKKTLNFERTTLLSLVKNFCDVSLNKEFQTADWAQRPLPHDLLNYAAQDTHYLLKCYDHLREEILGRKPETLLEIYDDACFSLAKQLRPKKPTSHSPDIAGQIYKARVTVARVLDENVRECFPSNDVKAIAEALDIRNEKQILAL